MYTAWIRNLTRIIRLHIRISNGESASPRTDHDPTNETRACNET